MWLFMKSRLKYILFYIYAVFYPGYIKPENCFVIDKSKCRIWNCKYHYKDNKYDNCQKEG